MNELAANFGMQLRAQRERRGLTLDDVAASTKIKASLLGALEGNDLTRWPKGIYGRAFLRAYAEAIGLAPESVMDDVLPLLRTPEDAPIVADEPESVEPGARPALRLTFGGDVVAPHHAAACTLDAVVTLAGVLLVAALIRNAADVSFSSAAALVALVWYPIAHGLFGGFAPTRWLTRAKRSGTVYLANDAAGGRQAFADYQVTN